MKFWEVCHHFSRLLYLHPSHHHRCLLLGQQVWDCQSFHSPLPVSPYQQVGAMPHIRQKETLRFDIQRHP